jgi:hypothetical protein
MPRVSHRQISGSKSRIWCSNKNWKSYRRDDTLYILCL